jgi:two-component sensor histidine kinase
MRIHRGQDSNSSPQIKGALRLTLFYLIVGAAWIILSDRALAALVQNSEQYAAFQTIKGWFYVAATSALFGIFAFAELRRIAALTESEIRARREFEETVKASLREKEALLRELNHRVKNNLQLISSLVSLRMDRIVDPATRVFFIEFLSRIKSMALVHDSLFATDAFSEVDLRSFIMEATAEYAAAFGSLGVRFSCTAEEGLKVDMEKAVPIALIINETVLNAVNHAFPDGKSGWVRLSAKRDGDALSLEIRDNGVGFDSAAVDEHSVGLTIVRELTAQIGATVEFASSSSGTAVLLRFEAAHASQKAPSERS